MNDDFEINNGIIECIIFRKLAEKIRRLVENGAIKNHYFFWKIISEEAKDIYDEFQKKYNNIEDFYFETIDLSGIIFKDNFHKHVFGQSISVKWLPPMDFSKCIFEGEVILDGIEFSGSLTFNKAIFQKSVNFENCKFKGPVGFNDSKFTYQSTNIGECSVSFENASFKSSVTFMEAQFHGMTKFNRTIFYAVATFMLSEFHEDIEFNGAKFTDFIDFSGCKFKSTTDYNNCKFKNSTHFNCAQFKNVPTFHGAALHEDTSFYKASFGSFSDEADWRAYRKLKQLMARNHAREEEGIFFACEQRARRYLNKKNSSLSVFLDQNM